MSLGNGLVEGLALGLSNAQLEGGGLAGTVTAGEGTGAPGRATVDLAEVGKVGCGSCQFNVSWERMLETYQRWSCSPMGRR